MSFFNFQWLRSFVRKRTRRIPQDRAIFMKSRLSLIYMLLSWNAFGFVVYMAYKGKADWAKDYKSEEEIKKTPAQQWASTLGIKDAKVLRISGANVSSYDIQGSAEDTNITGNEAILK